MPVKPHEKQEQLELEQETANSSPWAKLTPELLREVAARAATNDAALALKLLNKEAAECLSDYKVVQLLAPTTQPGDPELPVRPWPATAFVAHWAAAAPWRALSLRQRQRLLSLAAASGDAASLDAALAHCGCSVQEQTLECVAAAGCLPALQRLLQREGGRLGVRSAAGAAARAGQLGVLQWIMQHHRPLTPDASFRRVCQSLASAAAAGRQVHVVEWLLDDQQLVDLSVVESAHQIAAAAARSGLDALLARALPFATASRFELLTDVAFGCSLGVLQLHYESLVEGTDVAQAGLCAAVSAAAAGPGSDWLQKVDYLVQHWQQAAAALRGGTAATASTAGEVVIHMHYCGLGPPGVQRLQVLHERGRSLHPELFRAAAVMGHTDILAWALGKDLDSVRDVNTLAEAAIRGGQVHVMQLLKRRGFAYGPAHLRMLSILMLMPEQASAAVAFLCDAVEGASTEDWAALFTSAAELGASPAVLRRLHEWRGAAVNLEAMLAGGCAVDALAWALEVLAEAAATAAVTSAAAAAKAAEAAAGRRSCGARRAAGQDSDSDDEDDGAEQHGLPQYPLEKAWGVAAARNLAAADWLLAIGLVQPPSRLLRAEWVVRQVELLAVNGLGTAALGALAWWREQPGWEVLSEEQEARVQAAAARRAALRVWA